MIVPQNATNARFVAMHVPVAALDAASLVSGTEGLDL
jgi:hypothetical protein